MKENKCQKCGYVLFKTKAAGDDNHPELDGNRPITINYEGYSFIRCKNCGGHHKLVTSIPERHIEKLRYTCDHYQIINFGAEKKSKTRSFDSPGSLPDKESICFHQDSNDSRAFTIC